MKSFSTTTSSRPTLALLFGLLIIGSAAIFVRLADAPGPISAFYRMGFSSLLLFVPAYKQIKVSGRSLQGPGLRWGILGGLFIGSDMALWTTGIMLNGATLTTLFNNMAPIWVGLGAWLFFKEQRRAFFWIGLLVAIGGILFIFLPDLRSDQVGLNLGAVAGLTSSLFYAAYFLATQHGRTFLDTLSYAWITTTVAAVFLLLVNLVSGSDFIHYGPTTWLIFILMAILVQIGGWLSINYAQGYLPAAIVSPTLLGQPVLTAMFAALLLGERLNAGELLGGAVVLTGIYLVHFSRSSPDRVGRKS